jgi:hypothetical protein
MSRNNNNFIPRLFGGVLEIMGESIEQNHKTLRIHASQVCVDGYLKGLYDYQSEWQLRRNGSVKCHIHS